MRRHAVTGRMAQQMLDGHTMCTRSHCLALRYQASLTPALYAILFFMLYGLQMHGRFGWSKDVSTSRTDEVQKTWTSWPSRRMKSTYCRKRKAMPWVCGGM